MFSRPDFSTVTIVGGPSDTRICLLRLRLRLLRLVYSRATVKLNFAVRKGEQRWPMTVTASVLDYYDEGQAFDFSGRWHDEAGNDLVATGMYYPTQRVGHLSWRPCP